MIHFNYSIGDEVKLLEPPGWKNLRYDYATPHPDTVYVINGYGYEITEQGTTTYYQLSSDNNNLSYDNDFSEELLESVSENHPMDIDPTMHSTDGSELHIGDLVYTHLFDYDDKVNVRFTFTTYGRVEKFSFFRGTDSYNDKNYAHIKRTFLCVDEEGKDYKDARRFESMHQENEWNITKIVPEDYAERYVKAYMSSRYNKFLDEHVEYDTHAATSYLKHMCVYDKVMEIYKEKKGSKKKPTSKPKTKKAERKMSKVEKMLSGLSDKEKKEMFKLLGGK